VNVVVCVKHVPDTADVRVDPETKALVREGVEHVINPFDENAVEAALQLRDVHGGRVTAITMGPPQAAESLRHALAMGADEAVLLTDPASRGSDTLATSYTLAQMVRRLDGFDLIICGKQAIDGDTGQVGPGLAERLGVPQVTLAISLEIADGRLRARRVLDDFFEVIEVKLPAVATVVKQINEPRRPSMRNVLKARRAEIAQWSLADLDADATQTGFDGSPTQVVEVWPPRQRLGGKRLEGSTDDIVAELAGIIKEMSVPGG
jgi:electron transfer flavoprotein beta subunit